MKFEVILCCWWMMATCFLPECQSTVCYLCSWSPEENRTDYCTGDNWTPQMIGYVDCDYGCESVTQRDKNGEVSIFYRNCANDNAPKYTQCQKIPGKAGSRVVCACNTRLCNEAAFSTSSSLTLFIFISLILFQLISSHIFT